MSYIQCTVIQWSLNLQPLIPLPCFNVKVPFPRNLMIQQVHFLFYKSFTVYVFDQKLDSKIYPRVHGFQKNLWGQVVCAKTSISYITRFYHKNILICIYRRVTLSAYIWTMHFILPDPVGWALGWAPLFVASVIFFSFGLTASSAKFHTKWQRNEKQ